VVVRLRLAEIFLPGRETVGVVVDVGRKVIALFEMGPERDLLPGADVLDVVNDPGLEVDDRGHARPEPGHVLPHDRVDGAEHVLEDVPL